MVRTGSRVNVKHECGYQSIMMRLYLVYFLLFRRGWLCRLSRTSKIIIA